MATVPTTPVAASATTTPVTAPVAPPPALPKEDLIPAFTHVWGHIRAGGWRRFFYVSAVLLILLSAILAYVGYNQNVAGDKEINATFWVVISALLCALWIAPLFVLEGASVGPKTKTRKNYFLLLESIEIWVTVFFGGMSFLSFHKNPVFFWLLLPVFVFFSLNFRWGYESKWARPLIQGCFVVACTAMFIILASNTFSFSIFGVDIMPSKTDREINKIKADMEEEKNQLALEAWKKKAERQKTEIDDQKSKLAGGEDKVTGKKKDEFSDAEIDELAQKYDHSTLVDKIFSIGGNHTKPAVVVQPVAANPTPAAVQPAVYTPAPAVQQTNYVPAPTVMQIQFFPNHWDLQDKALQKVGYVKAGKLYTFNGFGRYTQYFAGDHGELKGKSFQFGPMGANWTPRYKELLPMPDRPLCSLIGMVNGEFFFIGEGTQKTFPSDGDLYVTINHIQDKAEFGNAARNFIDNEGYLTVSIREN